MHGRNTINGRKMILSILVAVLCLGIVSCASPLTEEKPTTITVSDLASLT